MSRLRMLQMMAGMRRTRAERVAERQIQRFRRQVAQHEQAVMLRDKILQREAGSEGLRPMPYARKP